MIFLVLSGKMIFLFPENIILPPRRKIKHDLSQKKKKKKKKKHGNMIFSSNVLKRYSFRKGAAPGHDLSCIIWKDGIFSQKHDIFSFEGK